MLEKQRHHLLLELLAEMGYASVPVLSNKLKASEATIRRDITKLSKRKALTKIRGGAQSNNVSSQIHERRHLKGSVFLADTEQNKDIKALIAEKAVSLCEEGESIIINGGSSTFMMKDALASRHLNILTNSFALAQELADNSDNQVTLPGGELYRKQSIILSSFENDGISNYHGSKMFMGTPAIGEFGLMETDPMLVLSEQKLLKQADQLIVLADSSKIGKRSSLILCSLDKVNILITDNKVEPRFLELFEKHKIQVITVAVPDSE
ncbi:DeoR/GlpR family DNA-binding transcription regulator [Aliiglaciecola sp. 3_MG-2023]|uniref:DeoR/GlpR family DNA-binding transcription regulator n=1 Tax=Aliiglaciecola sp. 3_MG-2023 TaxID=3062644 RepID=UPI0026E2879A|nr:DeoR/GlpR family DNA-binding transcription regulator [Aliiglaciecola sp. 3_MG-2023]MDO6693333.1 DeoR/GlpR family DNA-binding transcription regulator [Aliiglaciecola sp. 3_MG-2023]